MKVGACLIAGAGFCGFKKIKEMVKDELIKQWSSSRVNMHGKIDDLTDDFSLEGKPFSVFIVPKTGSFEIALLKVRLLGETGDASECPVVIGDWCPLAIVEVSKDMASMLDDYDIYWGRGV
jgi:hypothetical protein